MHYPPIFINEYIKEKVASEFDTAMPFFPTSPSMIDELTNTIQDAGSIFGVYDRMFRMRRSPFPHTKSEQLLYYLYKPTGGIARLQEITQLIQDLLDGEDESADDINKWIASKIDDGVFTVSGTEFEPVFFHKIRVYQLEEVRDIVDFGTARTFAGNKIIIDYDWHKS